VKFIVDAQLPRTLKNLLIKEGHNAIRTLDLVLKNATPDGIINKISEAEDRIVISKDTDFLQSYMVNGIPRNTDLLLLLRKHLDQIVELMSTQTLIEISETEIISHN